MQEITVDQYLLDGVKRPGWTYIAGPMTHRENFNFPAFDAVAERCRVVDGWTVLNPHEHDQETYPGIDDTPATEIGDVEAIAMEVGFNYQNAMVWDLQAVAVSEHLVLLPEWETSTGAKAERFVAEMTGSKIWLANHETWVDDQGYAGESWYLTLDPEQKRLAVEVSA
jgi:hypothetical protein